MTRTRASTVAPAIGAAPVSGDAFTLAAASGPMMTGAAAAGPCETRPEATSTSSSPGALQPSALHDNPTTTHDTGHPYFITTLPRHHDRERRGGRQQDVCHAEAPNWMCAATVRCAPRRTGVSTPLNA